MEAPRLIEIGKQAFFAVSQCAASGGPLLQCQLLAAEFYDALTCELREPAKLDIAQRFILIAVVHQCRRTAMAKNPVAMLFELKAAITILQFDCLPKIAERPKSRPVLRVIEGGLSR